MKQIIFEILSIAVIVSGIVLLVIAAVKQRVEDQVKLDSNNAEVRDFVARAGKGERIG